MNSPISRFGIIGDVHGEDRRLERALEHLACRGVDAILCTGDIADGRGCVDRCVALLTEYRVVTVRGNHDRWLLQNRTRHLPDAHHRDSLTPASVEFMAALPVQVTIETVAGPLLLCHGVGDNDMRKVWPGSERAPVRRCDILDGLIAEGQVRWIINGHMHFRTMIHFERLCLINAGTLKGGHWPGFLLIDLAAGTIEVVEFDGESARPALTMGLAPEPEHRVFRSTACFRGDWRPITLFSGGRRGGA